MSRDGALVAQETWETISASWLALADRLAELVIAKCTLDLGEEKTRIVNELVHRHAELSLSNDEERLLATVAAYRNGLVANNLHWYLPEKAGGDSAHCFGSAVAQRIKMSADGKLILPSVDESDFSESTPDPLAAANKKWLQRLRKRVNQYGTDSVLIAFLLPLTLPVGRPKSSATRPARTNRKCPYY